ncbi:UNVERIFIED_CONTAM: hypothetical protein HDU68_001690 [Siphonaria sp. JEL0065]|nr:hypothetical protein HDU68_001690 [Siphonaria sp. JEL0065]
MNGLGTEAIIGIAAGAAVALILGIVFLIKKRQRDQAATDNPRRTMWSWVRQKPAETPNLPGPDIHPEAIPPTPVQPPVPPIQPVEPFIVAIGLRSNLNGNPLHWTPEQTAYWASSIPVVGSRFHEYLTTPTNGQGMRFHQVNMLYTANKAQLKDNLLEAEISEDEVDRYVIPAIQERHGQMV